MHVLSQVYKICSAMSLSFHSIWSWLCPCDSFWAMKCEQEHWDTYNSIAISCWLWNALECILISRHISQVKLVLLMKEKSWPLEARLACTSKMNDSKGIWAEFWQNLLHKHYEMRLFLKNSNFTEFVLAIPNITFSSWKID